MKNYIKSGLPYLKKMLLVAIPIMIQSGVTNFVNLLDNIMIGQVGTLQMTGVSIVNQLLFVFNLCIFGSMSGAGIFTAQFYGKKDDGGIKSTVQYKVCSALILTAVGIGIFIFAGDSLVALYLKGEGTAEEIALVASYAKEYLKVMLWGLLPFALAQVYASSLRETCDRVLPMVSTVAAVFINLIFNYILIFGHFGAPEMGVKGAAIATVIARYAEFAILFICTHLREKKYPFMKKVYATRLLTKELVKKMTVIAFPLILNETLWALGMALLNQCYSIRGLDVVAAVNILSTISNVFNVAFIAFGSAIGIILSQMLGAGEKEKAYSASTKMLFFAVSIVVFIGLIMMCLAPLFPKIYNTTDEIRSLAASLIIVAAAFMPVQSCTNACYFTIRSGGNTLLTFLFDSGFVWVLSVPLAFCLSRLTDLPIIPLYIIVNGAEIIKALLGFIYLKKGIWLNSVVE